MNEITVVIPTSPIKSHPDTSIIEETISTIRHHLPDSDIILGFDGVVKQQEDFTERYNEYKTKMLWKCLHEYKNVLPRVYDEHIHQSGMMKDWLPLIKTPFILYVEGDTPLTPDRAIDWQKCINYIKDGNANTIRFHFENVIPKEHEGMMFGDHDDGFLKTIQWSQRPHLSTKVYYEDMMKFFPDDAKTFIEDEWHGVVVNDWNKDGKLGWYKHRLVIYYRKDGDVQRSYNLDGRGNEPKFGEGFAK